MTRLRQLERWSLRAAGGLVLLIAVGHIFMPAWGYPESVRREMTTAVKEHFYYLGTYAICAFLFAFTILTFHHSYLVGTRATLVFSGTMAAVWWLRVALEFSYPVAVPIFFLDYPHPVLVPVVITIASAFTCATAAGMRTYRG